MAKKIEWTLQERCIDDLKRLPNNPRVLSRNDHQALANSLERYGLIDKPVVNLDGQVIGGHQRLTVLREKGISVVECWVPSRQLTAREVDELAIRLNRNTGEWDWDILANEWDGDDLLAWGFEAKDFGFPSKDEQAKPPTFRATLTFVDEQSLEEAREELEHIATKAGAKLKVSG